ncbi:bifunctional diaminohydroxyphosphoribosylaminopyrimidine deaminase/5-amino-6-(5-phosphoribosylamino)uracil reductase RibD [Algoriphagus halophytocola]|uniref:Riboflavin biosynthesis protein RibD n=1 Tax=Algoriphagus halophytocola TaxID=2991499 RepID=A0ABY6MF78_9BACT|nr:MULTISPECIES: bifunctional diaminohydroxyphosphoribosylaminopyrimidine deaminase/5-amino-6-(5-phosphoribosylamino)uracil reductase RibD [unclassified Algoriphagus]UZD21580.1 bifunctional diaminohydroxyphosphoribosylaminopyrimidine deaminase/5-amino-6-(5-phosphoribosylamino)uracil reductase RibD [Algoriphagus sp. TR-M5]WBL42793.1 bifunctional diaminohydroxyphosphoribosylaminopyrimidine deaminase/5-amino-6-(5-phosphoribosylamino)uracil reductase RibD [Algoriphagus sp. TR-M9]
MESGTLYMQRALELAELGRGKVSPNPMVGCVIVHRDQIIGEGYHQEYGKAHAEVNAIHSVKNQSLLAGATVYVTLEPCAHFGKTPPCANLLVEKQVKKVVIAAFDTNPLVGGKGIQILRDAGIEVITGVLEQEARWQNKRFFTQIEKKRPYVILKWAQTQDGFVAREDFSSKWITNASSRQLVHKWRAEEDAIMVGKNTAKYDDPALNVRDWVGKNPLRIVIDSNLELQNSLKLFDEAVPTICYNVKKQEVRGTLEFVKLPAGFTIADILSDLHARKVQSVLIEGGSYLLKRILESELWDEARVFTSRNKFGSGIPAPLPPSPVSESIEILEDTLRIYHHV